jgi:hypothetical protein
MWTSHPNCTSHIKATWAKVHSGSHFYILRKKLEDIRDQFRERNKHTFGKVEREIDLKKEELQTSRNISPLLRILQEKGRPESNSNSFFIEKK